jgi:hypothetical protein
MMRRLGLSALVALALAAPALVAQDAVPAVKTAKPPISPEPWPDDDALVARQTEAQQRSLFQEGPPLEVTLASDFNLINKERSPNNGKLFPGVLTVGGKDIAVKLGSRGHLRLNDKTCDFVPIKIEFASTDELPGTVFEGQTSLKLGTHCRTDRDFDQYVVREYLSYRFTNLVTPLSFRARLAHVTYVDARSKKKLSTHNGLFLEHENDVARRLRGRQAKVLHMLFKEFDQDALTTTMMIEYMLGNTDYSIWALHNVVVVQDKQRRFLPVAYDFDSSGMVNPPYAAPDERLHLKSTTDRLYRGPCRTVEEIDKLAEPFRAHKADMFAAVEAATDLNAKHRREVTGYLESFFERIGTASWIKRTFVDGCPATRQRV